MTTNKSNKKVTSLVLILSLLSGCAITPKQINANDRIVYAIGLCFSTFEDDLKWSGKIYNSYNRREFSEKIYDEFYDIKQKYPKEWENFKKRPKTVYNSLNNRTGEEDFWSVTLGSVLTLGIVGINTIYKKSSKAPKGTSYAELLPICEEKMDSAMKMLPFKKEIEAKQKELRLEELRSKNKEVGNILKRKQIAGYVKGIWRAVFDIYNRPNKESYKNMLIIFDERNPREDNLMVRKVHDSYAIYSNQFFTIAVKKSPNKSYLKDSILSGYYYRFIGIRTFGNKTLDDQQELIVLEEVSELEKYSQDSLKLFISSY